MSEQRKSVYIAYTGGTIGMKPSANGYVPVAGFLAKTLAAMPEFHRAEMPTFILHEYPNLIDSSDMDPNDWQCIADDIQQHYLDYDAFIILHGTDTMAYTASALSFMFENLAKPVIITGSQIPLAELRSDGQVNLLNALYVAANYPIAEVCLFFNNQLYRGNRCRKIDADGFAAFASPNFQPLLDAGIHVKVDATRLINNATEVSPLQVTAVKAQAVAVLMLYPGIDAEVIQNILQRPVKALILLSYGVGNAPQQPSILQTLSDATARGIVILNCTQCWRGSVNMDGYATGHALKHAGVISGHDMTPEAALAKLHYLLSQPLNYAQITAQLSQNLRGELSDNQ